MLSHCYGETDFHHSSATCMCWEPWSTAMREREIKKERERDWSSGGFGWIRRVLQCLTGVQGNFTHACCLLTLAHGAGTVLQHITISIWHCLLCLMPTHTNTQLLTIQANHRHHGNSLLATGKADAWSESKTEQRGAVKGKCQWIQL